MSVAREAALAAESILDEYWDGTIPVDPARIAHAMGIRVVDAYLDPDVAGAIQKDKGKQVSIYLNYNDAATRKRFTCAHEIGHFDKHSKEPVGCGGARSRGDRLSRTPSTRP